MDRNAYLQALERRTAELIAESDDPQQAMRDLAEAATESGLILDEAVPRYETPEMFAAALLMNNPAASDFINAKFLYEAMEPDPRRFESVDEFVSVLRPAPR